METETSWQLIGYWDNKYSKDQPHSNDCNHICVFIAFKTKYDLNYNFNLNNLYCFLISLNYSKIFLHTPWPLQKYLHIAWTNYKDEQNTEILFSSCPGNKKILLSS